MKNKDKSSATNIKNCVFKAVEFDLSIVETLSIIERVLNTNAEALSALSKIISASNINVDAMVKVTGKAEKKAKRNREGFE